MLSTEKLPQLLLVRGFSESPPGNSSLVACLPAHGHRATEEFLTAQYGSPLTIAVAAPLRLLLIAEGLADVCVEIIASSEWETCAAHAILLCAGGSVQLLQEEVRGDGGISYRVVEGSALLYNKPVPLNPPFIAYGGRMRTEQVRGAGPHPSSGTIMTYPHPSQVVAAEGGALEGGRGEMGDSPDQTDKEMEAMETSEVSDEEADGDLTVTRAGGSGLMRFMSLVMVLVVAASALLIGNKQSVSSALWSSWIAHFRSH